MSLACRRKAEYLQSQGEHANSPQKDPATVLPKLPHYMRKVVCGPLVHLHLEGYKGSSCVSLLIAPPPGSSEHK